MKGNTSFSERKLRRQELWKGELLHGHNTDAPRAEGSIAENINSLEELRHMMYPELHTGRIDKSAVKIFKR